MVQNIQKEVKKANIFKSQYTAGAAVLLASVTNGTLSGWATACLPLLKSNKSPVAMDHDQLSWVMSIQFFGQMLSPIPAGLLMDRYGTKTTLFILSFLLPLPSLLLIYITNHWTLLLVSRFLSGYWVGSVNTIAPMYLSEISVPKRRGFLNTMYNVTFRIGNIYALISALFISYENLPILYSISAVIFILIFPAIPESPHYYLKQKNQTSAKESLIWLRNYKNDCDIDAELKDLQTSIDKQMENKSRFIDLVSTKGNRKALLIVETLAVLQKLAGLGSIISYLSITLPETILLEPSILVIIIETLRLISAFIASLIIDRTGSRVLLLSGSITCGLMMFLTGLWFFFDSINLNNIRSYTWVPFVCITVHGTSFALGLNSVCNTIRSELFPINIKGKCSAVTCMITGLASFLVSKMYLIIGEEFGVFVNFWIYAVSSFMITLFSSVVFIETKGKSLQQIQDELNTPKNRLRLQSI